MHSIKNKLLNNRADHKERERKSEQKQSIWDGFPYSVTRKISFH